jgi:hypothetical protein
VYSFDSTIPKVRVLTPGTAVAAWATADMPNVLAKMLALGYWRDGQGDEGTRCGWVHISSPG